MAASAPTAVANPIRLKTSIHQAVTLGISSCGATKTLNHQNKTMFKKKRQKETSTATILMLQLFIQWVKNLPAAKDKIRRGGCKHDLDKSNTSEPQLQEIVRSINSTTDGGVALLQFSRFEEFCCFDQTPIMQADMRAEGNSCDRRGEAAPRARNIQTPGSQSSLCSNVICRWRARKCQPCRWCELSWLPWFLNPANT